MNGYPDMTVRQLCDALDARYASRKLPAERHVQQLVAKVATADDATTAAAAMAKFHHRRAAAFASMKLPRKRHGLTPQSLMMFIGACHRVGATRLALASAENHNAMGLPMIKPALLKLCEACEDVDQVLRVYNLWRKEGWEVDASIAEAVVMAAARVGEADAAGNGWPNSRAPGSTLSTRPSARRRSRTSARRWRRCRMTMVAKRMGERKREGTMPRARARVSERFGVENRNS